MKKTQKQKKERKIITIDFECTVVAGTHYPILMGIYNGETFDFVKYDREEKDWKTRATSLVKKGMEKLWKYEKEDLYIHNLSKYDSFIFLKYFDGFFRFKSRNNEIYQLTIIDKENWKKIIIKDSYHLLRCSLKDACKAFEIDKKYWKKEIESSKFEEFEKNEEELIEYLKYDCISLFHVLSQFTSFIYNTFQIKRSKYLTISGLSFSIWRIMDNNVSKIEKNVYSDSWKDEILRTTYFGGRNEIFKPVVSNGFFYDINSLYPFIMKTCEMPTGKGKLIIWDAKKHKLEEKLRFLYCKIKTPENLYIPWLPYRTTEGEVIYPLGEFFGCYFSPELEMAREKGYEITPINGIEYEGKETLFNSFVNFFYTRKVEAKNIYERTIYKAILNSISGKFGMARACTKLKLLDFNSWMKKEEELVVSYCQQLEPNKFIVFEQSEDNFVFSSVQIASAITSYARIFMNKIIESMDPSVLVYIDNDAIVTTKRLEEALVCSKTLGKFKCVEEIRRGYFVTNKFYCLLTQTGEIIKKTKGITMAENEKIDEETFKNLLKDKEKTNLLVEKSARITRNYNDLSIKTQTTDRLFTNEYTKREKVYLQNSWRDTKARTIKEGKRK